MHFNLHYSVTLTAFTAASLDIKGKSARRVSPALCVRGHCEKLPDIIEYARVGCRIGTRCSADWRLVNVDNLVKIFNSEHFIVLSGETFCAVKLHGKTLVYNLVDER